MTLLDTIFYVSPECFLGQAMSSQYIAKIYSTDKELAEKDGNDVEELYVWMLTYDIGHGCGAHGEIIEIETQSVVKTFTKSPIE